MRSGMHRYVFTDLSPCRYFWLVWRPDVLLPFLNIRRSLLSPGWRPLYPTISPPGLDDGSMHLEKSALTHLHGLDEPKGRRVPRKLAFHLGTACQTRRSDRDGL